MQRATSLARSIAPWHPAVAWAWFASALVLASAWPAHGFESALRGGVATFLAWASTRELAPRRLLASLLAPFAAVAFAIPAETDLVACLGVLVAARVALRSTGTPPTPLDRVVLLVLAWWLATIPVGLPVALVLGAVVFADDHRAVSRATGGLVLGVVLVTGSLEGTLTMRPGIDEHATAVQVLLAVLVAAGVALLAWPLPRRLRVTDDRRGRRARPLLGARLRVARLAAVASVAAAVAWTGTGGALALSAASAGIVAAAIGGPGASGTLAGANASPRRKGAA
jgi:hypothetical protein